MVLAVDEHGVLPQQAGQQGPPPHRDGMDFRPVVIVGNMLERLDVLIQRAAQHDVHHLNAPADAQHRLVCREERPQQLRLGGVPQKVRLAAGGDALLPVEGRVHVAAARQQESVEGQRLGHGAKGVGDTAIRNYNKWADIRVNMDTLCENGTPDTHVELFGRSFKYPFFAGPVGAVNLHYSDVYTDMTYNDVLVRACAESGIAAFTGDGTNPDVMTMATKAIGNADGCGVPTIKPWNIDTIKEKMAQAKASGCFAVAMDVDAAGLPFLKNMTPPAGSKSVAELAEIVKLAERPFIVKGVMTVKGALKAKEAGAAAIVVSNHGGRVLDQCPATAEVLPEIAAALKGTGVKVLVDGGIRTGVDVFKALALGADGVLICRPFVTAVYGGGEEGVKCYIDKLAGELADTMQMCGAHSIEEITPDMVRV